ncbi:MAG: YbaB/EbfC family nucleoid-associated protein [Rickettsiales bacterium]|nr:YbaB/EbfC family nucleoid-associated protein [Rickettsiales bacterium]
MKALMRQAQDMQKKMQKAQEDLANEEFEGSAGGGMVVVTINGAGILKKINIDSEIVKVEEKDIMEDLIIAAVNDAKKKADDASSDSLKSATGNIQLPPGFGF